MKIYLPIILSLIIFFCVGCGEEVRTNDNGRIIDQTKKDITDSIIKIEIDTKIIEEKTENISQEAQKIYDDTVKIESGLSEVLREKMGIYLVDVKNSSQTIIVDAKEVIRANMDLATVKTILENASDKVETTDELFKTLVKERDDLTIALEEAEEARDSALHKMLQYLIIGCVVGCGAFIVLFFYTGSKGGLMAAGGCGLVLIIAIFVNKYIFYLAIGGGVLLLVMAGLLLYNIYIKNKAFKEVVDTVEVAQDNMTKEDIDKIFGKNGQTGIMDGIQSKSTMELVKKEKTKMASLWSYAKVKNGKEEKA